MNYGDDFSYNLVVQNWLETGELKITDWTSMMLFGHVLLGYVWSSLVGYSYDNIRVLMLVLGLLGQIGAFKLINYHLKNSKISFWISFLFTAQTTYIIYSSHFATDITWFTFVVWSFYFLTKYLKEDKLTDYLVGSFLIVYSGTIRELSFIFAFAFIVASIKERKSLLLSVIPAILILTFYFSFRYWLENYNGMPLLMDLGKEQMLTNFSEPFSYLKRILGTGFKIVIYSSFIFAFLNQAKKIIPIFALSIFFTLLFSEIIYHKEIFEFFAGYIPAGFKLGDIHNPDTAYLESFAPKVSIFVITTGIFNILLNIKTLLNLIFIEFRITYLFTFKNLSIILYSLFILNLFPYIRYIFLPISLLLINSKIKIKTFNKVLIVLFLIVSIFISRDQFNIVKKQENMIRFAITKMNIKHKELDAGFDHAARHFFDMRKSQPDSLNWYWVEGDKYLIRSGLVEGYKVIKKDSLQRYFPPMTQYFYLLEEK